MAVDWITLTFAFGLGVGTFFNPCSVALVPAYIAYYAGTTLSPQAEGAPRGEAWRRGLSIGAASCVGVLVTFGLAGGLLFSLRAGTDLDADEFVRGLAIVAAAVGSLIIVLGVLLLTGRGPRIVIPVRAPRRRNPLSVAAFGALYALASLGCSAALFFAAVAQALLQDALGAFLVLVFYALGLGGLLFVFAVFVTVSGQRAPEALRRLTPYMHKAAGAVMILSGLYVWYYYFVANPAF